MSQILITAISSGQLLCASLLLACLFSSGWGMRSFFVQPAGTTAGMKTIKLCGLVFAILHLALILLPHTITLVQTGIAVAIYLAALALFWWAIDANRAKPLSAVFSPDLPVHLTDTGPYRFIRHPFYTSYLLTWTAGVIASGRWWLLATVIVMGVIYWKAARMEEGKFESSALARDYESYRARTGLFIPNPLRAFAPRKSLQSHHP